MKDGSIVGADSKNQKDAEAWCLSFFHDPEMTREDVYSRIFIRNQSLLSICKKYSDFKPTSQNSLLPNARYL